MKPSGALMKMQLSKRLHTMVSSLEYPRNPSAKVSSFTWTSIPQSPGNSAPSQGLSGGLS